jgi:Flp pilus assembly protein TadG
MVEFALVLPLLLLLVLAMTDFGKAFNYWIDETHLANEGARLAAVNGSLGTCPDGTTPGTLQQYIQCQATTSELRSSAQVEICFPNGAAANGVGQPVRVKVQVTYNWLAFVAPHMPFAQATITGTSTMRLEAPPPHPYTTVACT